MNAAEKLLTLAQAAERSECSVKTIRRAIAAGSAGSISSTIRPSIRNTRTRPERLCGAARAWGFHGLRLG